MSDDDITIVACSQCQCRAVAKLTSFAMAEGSDIMSPIYQCLNCQQKLEGPQMTYQEASRRVLNFKGGEWMADTATNAKRQQRMAYYQGSDQKVDKNVTNMSPS